MKRTENDRVATPRPEDSGFLGRCSVEERTLLGCLRQDWTESCAVRVAELVDEGVDWARLLAIAVRHQVAPLVFHNLSRSDGVTARVPPDTVARFHHETMRNMAAKSTMAKRLEEVLGWFGERGVELMLIKGTSLDRRVFDEEWFTVSGDIDLLLRLRAHELDAELRKRAWDLNHESLLVDVHSVPHPDLVMNGVLPVDFDGIWQRADSIQVGAHRAFCMHPEDELLTACIQSCRKRYFRMKSLCEIGELLARGAVRDWDRFAARAIEWECHWIVYTALFAAHVALGCELPADLRARLHVPVLRASALRYLTRHRSFSSFETLYDRVELRGKNLSRSLLLPYASHTWRQWGRSLVVLGRQLRRTRK